MAWILAAFAAPLLHGFANVLDNVLANRHFKNVWTLTFYVSLLNLVFIPLVFFLEVPSVPPLHVVPLLFLLGATQVGYLYPYYKALQHEDTSVIAALFSLGRIFVPFLAFLVVGEVLTTTQYAGFVIVVIASVALTYKPEAKLRFSSSLFYMAASSFILAIEAVAYKYAFEHVSWSTGFVWPLVFAFLIVFSFFIVASVRTDIKANFGVFRSTWKIFALEEAVSFLGTGMSLFALSLAPVTIVKSIGSLQAVVVLLYALFLHRLFPRVFKEDVDMKSLMRKGAFFLVLVFGVFLTLQGEV